MLIKCKREVDKGYLEFIKKQPCLCRYSADCIGDISPHHTITKGAGGSDYDTVPLCAFHHMQCHTIGRDTFQRKHGISFKKSIALLKLKYASLEKDRGKQCSK